MKKYLFKTAELGITENGIHLLRSGFNYRTIEWADVRSVRIEKGMLSYNWLAVLCIGLLVISVGIYVGSMIFHVGTESRQAARLMSGALMILIAGFYFTYSSLERGFLFKITHGNKKEERFPLRELIARQQISEFKNFVTRKCLKNVE